MIYKTRLCKIRMFPTRYNFPHRNIKEVILYHEAPCFINIIFQPNVGSIRFIAIEMRHAINLVKWSSLILPGYWFLCIYYLVLHVALGIHAEKRNIHFCLKKIKIKHLYNIILYAHFVPIELDTKTVTLAEATESTKVQNSLSDEYLLSTM